MSDQETYKAVPNQKVYDTPHATDHVVEVTQIYFAEQVKKYKLEEGKELYVVKSGGKIKDVLKRYEQKDREDLQANPDHNNPLKPKEEITITWKDKKEDGFELKKTDMVKLKKEIYVVAKCTGDGGKLSIQIYENKQTNETLVYDNPIKFLIDKAEADKIDFNIVKDKIEYSQKITWRPESEQALKDIIDKMGKRSARNAFLYFKAELTPAGNDKAAYFGNNPEFLNEDGQREEVILRDTCPIDPANRSHFVIHNTAGAQAMSLDGAKGNVNYGKLDQKRSKAHKYVLRDGTVFEVWPFSDKNVWATRTESEGPYKGKNVHVPPGQMFHIELSYGTKEKSPSEAQYASLANLYVEASEVEGCWPIIVPHKAVDRGIFGAHVDPENFDYDYFYGLLKQKGIPIDCIPKYTGGSSATNNEHTWPPKL